MIHTHVERGGHWHRLILAAPPGNILSLALLAQLREVVGDTAKHAGVKWLTLEGAGGDFSFGASIPEHLPEPMPRVLGETHQLLRELLAFPAPTAALVRGRCLGGGFELTLACDDIIAVSDASLGLPEIALAAFPPAAAALLPPRVGTSRAARAMLTGEARPATYWHEAGLVSLVAPDRPLLDAARDWFDRHLAPRSPVALRHAAAASRVTLRAIAEPALEAAETRYLEQLLRSADAEEGVRAWMEKRQPRWRGV